MMSPSNVIKIVVSSWVASGLLLYVIAAFIAADFNMVDWFWIPRLIIAFIWIIVCALTTIVGGCYIADYIDKKK